MCGIAGIYNENGISDDGMIIEKMSKSIIHRGPDEKGYHLDFEVALASRRLSIIDLKEGRQPVYNKDRSLTIVYNGEIYNYISLKKDLIKRGHSFYTKSDTEVILHAYMEYKEESLLKLKNNANNA